MAEPTMDQVCQALYAVYRGGDTAIMAEALVWLDDFKKSIHAWSISNQLLSKHENLEYSSFASQTLRAKIKFQFHELPQKEHGNLRSSLMAHLAHQYSQVASIRTQLCLALVDLALQSSAWQTFVSDFFIMFETKPDVLLQVLTFIPEEIIDSSLRLGIGRRNEVLAELTQNFTRVHSTMVNFLKSDTSEESLTKVFNLMAVWFYAKVVPEEQILTSPFWEVLFSVLKNPSSSEKLHQSAAECLSDIVIAVEDIKLYPNLSGTVLEAVLNLFPYFEAAKEDNERCLSFCRVFTYMAESFGRFMVQNPGQGLGRLDQLEVLVKCLEHPNYEVAGFTFHFWLVFGDILYEEGNTATEAIFAPYVERIIPLIAALCQLEPAQTEILTRTDEFYDFRQGAHDAINEVVFIIDPTKCFERMFEILKTANTWMAMEAILFVMQSIAVKLLPEEDSVVPEVLHAVLEMPADSNPQLVLTGLQLIGELAEWIYKHNSYIERVLQYLLHYLEKPTMATVASKSMENLCLYAGQAMTRHFPNMLLCLQSAEGKINALEQQRLLKGIASILSKMGAEEIQQGMVHLTNLQTSQIIQALSANPAPTSIDSILFEHLERLSIIWRQLKLSVGRGAPAHPCYPAICNALPIVRQAFSQRVGSPSQRRLAEKTCKCLRFAVRCLRTHFQPLLADTCTFLVEQYVSSAHSKSLNGSADSVGDEDEYESCWLYVASIIVDEFAQDPDIRINLVQMFYALAQPTFITLGKGPNAFTNNPDTVDDFFRLALRFLQHGPVALVSTKEVATALLRCAIAGLGLRHREAMMSIIKFLTTFVLLLRQQKFPELAPLLSPLVTEQGESLVFGLLKAVVISLPRPLFPDTVDLFGAIKTQLPEGFKTWLSPAINAVLEDSSVRNLVVDRKEVDTFYHSFLGQTDARKTTELLNSFNMFFK